MTTCTSRFKLLLPVYFSAAVDLDGRLFFFLTLQKLERERMEKLKKKKEKAAAEQAKNEKKADKVFDLYSISTV